MKRKLTGHLREDAGYIPASSLSNRPSQTLSNRPSQTPMLLLRKATPRLKPLSLGNSSNGKGFFRSISYSRNHHLLLLIVPLNPFRPRPIRWLAISGRYCTAYLDLRIRNASQAVQCLNGWVQFTRVHLGQRAEKPAQGRSQNTQHQTRQKRRTTDAGPRTTAPRKTDIPTTTEQLQLLGRRPHGRLLLFGDLAAS